MAVPIIPNIPVATDLDTAIMACNALRQAIIALTNQRPVSSAGGPSGDGGSGGEGAKSIRPADETLR